MDCEGRTNWRQISDWSNQAKPEFGFILQMSEGCLQPSENSASRAIIRTAQTADAMDFGSIIVFAKVRNDQRGRESCGNAARRGYHQRRELP